MLSLPITYEDIFTGDKVTKTFYFNLTKAELLELEKSKEGGFSSIITSIIEEGNNEKLIPYFKKIIELSYGERTDDGRFRKSEEAREAFLSSEAYSELFFSFFEEEKLVQFINGVMPKELMAEVNKKYPGGIDNPSKVIADIKQEKENAAKDNNSTN